MSDNAIQTAELAVAKHLFERIARMNKHDLPGLTVWGQPLGEFCGDLVMSAPRPSGGVNILLGDFVGYGLPAAVGALPVAEVFYGMTEKGFGLSDIIEEINKKLLFVLPEGLFCAACLIELDQEGKMLAVWNGGLPDLLVVDQHSQIKHRVPSAHIPLGINETEKVDLETVFIEVDAGDKVFCYTDGAVNASNHRDERFGQDKVEQQLKHTADILSFADALTTHIEKSPQQDDMTILELDIALIQKADITVVDDNTKLNFPPASWQVDFNFSAEVLKQLDLVPVVVNMLMQIQAPHEHKQRIYTVIAEMYSNALEHGVLKLESSLKQSVNGFAEYYSLRAQRLAELENASIQITLKHEPFQEGGKLTVRVEDSGDGFDFQKHSSNLFENKELCGRGYGLLEQLCSEYSLSGKGNIATAVYLWTA